MNEKERGPAGETGATGATGAAGPPGAAAELTEADYEKIPPGYQHVASFLRKHPRLKGPSMITIVLWIVLLVGGGILYISVTHANDAVARVHNQSACTLRKFIAGARDRALATAADPSQSESARSRARQSIADSEVLIASQVTIPKTFDCTKLFKQIAQEHVG